MFQLPITLFLSVALALSTTGCSDASEDETDQASAGVVAYSVDYLTDANIDESYVIDDVDCILQYPELPNGCEVTALAIALNYAGLDADKCDLASNYLATGPIGTTTPEEAYIGDPFSKTNGYYCYAPVIVSCAEDYITANASDLTVTDLTGSSLGDLLALVDEGTPVIVWATMYMEDASYTLNIEGELYPSSLHCMVLYGYDLAEDVVYISDPLVGNTTYSIEDFLSCYKAIGSQAVVIS